MEYIPPALRQVREFAALIEAQEPELQDLWDGASAVLDEQFVETGSQAGLLRWEKLLGIAPKAADTLEMRRFQIMTRLILNTPYTLAQLTQILTALCGEAGYSLTLEPDIYRLTVHIHMAEKEKYSAVEQLLQKMIPANLALTLSLEYNRHGQYAEGTHEALSAYTHLELREKVINLGE